MKKTTFLWIIIGLLIVICIAFYFSNNKEEGKQIVSENILNTENLPDDLMNAKTPENILSKLKYIESRVVERTFIGDLNNNGIADAIYTVKGSGESSGYLYAVIDKFNTDGSAKIFVDIAPFISVSNIKDLSINNGVISIKTINGDLKRFEFKSPYQSLTEI